MESSILSNISNIIYQDDLTLAYAGRFSDTLTDKIIGMAELYLESHQELNKLRKKTSFLVAECFQNVVRHGSKILDSEIFSMGKESFLIRFYENRCFIASVNSLPNSEVDILRDRLEEVNKLNSEELKKLHKTSLAEGILSEKGGAGLGLIEMARKTGNKLHYSFMSMDDDTSTFYLMLVLEHEKERGKVTDYSAELIENEGIINALRSAEQFLLYHGDFAQEIIVPVIEMIENNLDAQEGPLATKIKLYHATVESMQVISHLSHYENLRNVGALSLGKSVNGYVVNSINPVLPELKVELEQVLERLKSVSQSESEELFNALIKDGVFPELSEVIPCFTGLSRIGKSWDHRFISSVDIPLQFLYQVCI